MTETITPDEPIYWELVFGAEERDRLVYIDAGDGSYLSEDAESRAQRGYLTLAKNGVTCGLYRNGICVAGLEMVKDDDPPATVVHKTRTVQGSYEVTGKRFADGCGAPSYSFLASAFCSCGWSVVVDNRTIARIRARRHREEMSV